MKKAVIAVMSMMTLMASAQKIEEHSKWFNGYVVLEAAARDAGSFVLMGNTEVEGTTIYLTPIAGKEGEYTARWGEDEETSVMQVKTVDGKKTIVEIEGGEVVTVFKETSKELGNATMDEWKTKIEGRYTLDSETGKSVVVGRDAIEIDGVKYPYVAETHHKMPCQVVNISGDSEWAGTWRLRYADNGLEMKSCKKDENQVYRSDNRANYKLIWADGTKGRWAFTSSWILVNDIEWFSTTQLQLMEEALNAKKAKNGSLTATEAQNSQMIEHFKKVVEKREKEGRRR